MPLPDLGTLFDMDVIDNVTALTEAWKIASTKIKDIKTEIETKTSDSAAESVLMDLKEKLSAALTDESATKTSLLEELLQNRKSHAATNIDPPNSEIEVLSESRPSSSKHDDVFTPRPKEETPLTARFTAPKEYKHGENFTTWCSRFRNNSRQYRNGYNNNNRHQNRGRPTPGYGRRETRTCFICQIQGHIAANCSQNRLNPNRAGDSPSTGPEQ